MKINFKVTNYIKFNNSRNIKISDKVLLKYEIINSSYKVLLYNNNFSSRPSTWIKKIITVDHIRSNGLFKIKEDNGQYHWDKSWIKYNYSNYKFEVL